MNATQTPLLSIGQCATLACLLEVAAPKPGNVHRGADFADLKFSDFLASAVAIGPAMERAAAQRLGRTVLEAVTATRQSVATNTNLGIILLLAPLAAVDRSQDLASGVRQVLDDLQPVDAEDVYRAIALAQPGGMGQVEEMDLAETPPDDLLAAMRLAESRDLIARQYVDSFDVVLQEVVGWLVEGVANGWSLTDTIIDSHLRLLSHYPDSLIQRKCGLDTARQASDRAAQILTLGQPGDAGYLTALADFDFWLRSDHHRRNPGTTADLITAGLFAVLRDGAVQPPFR